MKNYQFLQRIRVVTHLRRTLTEKRSYPAKQRLEQDENITITTSCEAHCSPASWVSPFFCGVSKQWGRWRCVQTTVSSLIPMDQGQKGSAHCQVSWEQHQALWESPYHDSSPQRLSRQEEKKKIHPQSIIYKPGASPSLSLEAPDAHLSPFFLNPSIKGLTNKQY